MSEVDILYQIANLKEIDYKNTLMLTSLLELLIDKNIITRKEILEKTKEMDDFALCQNELTK